MKKPEILVVIADTHCGSVHGLCPPDYRDSQDIGIAPTARSIWQWGCWQHFLNKRLPDIVRGDPFALVLNGDLIEGFHHGGKELLQGSIVKQSRLAQTVLRTPCRYASRVMMTVGTECHTTDAEHELAESLGAKKQHADKATNTVLLQFKWSNVNIRHHARGSHMPTTHWGTAGRAMINEKIAADAAGEDSPDVLITAHNHQYSAVETDTWKSAVCFPWQLPTRHADKAVPDNRPAIGSLVLDWRGRSEGEAPIIHPCGYRPDPPKRERIC